MKVSSHARLAGLFSCLAVMGASVPAAAAPVEIMPMVGWRFGGNLSNYSNYNNYNQPSLTISSSASYGVVLDAPIYDGPYAIELYYSHQHTTLGNGQFLAAPIHDLTVNVVHVGVAATIPTSDPHLSWLVIGSAGATDYQANSTSDAYPSLGIGVGVRWMASPHVGFRADVRALLTFLNGGNTFISCGGGCNGYYQTSAALQSEASVGLVVRF